MVHNVCADRLIMPPHTPCVDKHEYHQGGGDCHNDSYDNTTCYETISDCGRRSNCSKQCEGKGNRSFCSLALTPAASEYILYSG